MGLPGVSGQTYAPLLNHGDLSWNLEMAGLRLLRALAGLEDAGAILLPQHSASEICPVADKVPPLVPSGLGALMTPECSLPRSNSLASGSKPSRVQHSSETNANHGGALAVGPWPSGARREWRGHLGKYWDRPLGPAPDRMWGGYVDTEPCSGRWMLPRV